MDLTFQVPMQYCSLQHWTLLPSQVTSTAGWCFCFGSVSPFFLEVFLLSSSILGTYRPGEFLFQCPLFLPFHTVHGVLKARILKCFCHSLLQWTTFCPLCCSSSVVFLCFFALITAEGFLISPCYSLELSIQMGLSFLFSFSFHFSFHSYL